MEGMRRKVTDREEMERHDRTRERKSVDCEMRKRILIFKQLFFLNFQGNYRTKICLSLHQTWRERAEEESAKRFCSFRSC